MMARKFKSKLRRLGDSLGTIVPEEAVREAGAREGDVVMVTIQPAMERRKAWFRKYGGIDKGAEQFERDRKDRF